MNAERRPRRLVEQRQSACEIQVRVSRDKLRCTESFDKFRNQNGARACVLDLARVLGISKKGKMLRAGLLHAGHARNLQSTVAAQMASQCAREISKSLI